MGDLSSRRGMIQGMEDNATGKVIRAEVPLAEMFGYSTTMRSYLKVEQHIQWNLSIIQKHQETQQKQLLIKNKLKI